MTLEKQIRYLIILFIVGLVFSGVTAFPIETLLAFGKQCLDNLKIDNSLSQWINFVYKGVTEMNKRFPFMAYGTDWLAFAHLVIAVVFIGPLRDPIKNIWVIQFGLIACVAIFPLAIIAGGVRGIPMFWRLIDCSFGVIGGILLWICYQKILKLEKIKTALS
ncbi:hypothetical protein [Pseudochryseolinea flava]|uniref:Uncharacterized protein n=1 Tax=Pseudochryseolinea flava TaxID=2059302 RepID=A0A364Y104_9BACT|nr:hypothetical protein [Pseudochryseolinea flava]RAW00355.1 hypothetical protein DQQ10_14980 [Pseudochryseolinea flava]